MKVTFVKSARKPIYKSGIIKTNPNGTRRFIRTIPIDDKDEIVIQKGESYYFWKFRNCAISVSKTEPTFEQLLRYGKSEWDEKIEEFEKAQEELKTVEDRDNLINEIEDYQNDLQERLSNMPDSLQESSVLNERIEELDSLRSEVEVIEVEDNDEEE